MATTANDDDEDMVPEIDDDNNDPAPELIEISSDDEETPEDELSMHFWT